jgi:beta-alanine degradation protein BauB
MRTSRGRIISHGLRVDFPGSIFLLDAQAHRAHHGAASPRCQGNRTFGQEVGMRRLTLVAMAVCLAGTTGLAQDPVKVSPKNYHVVVDNARVRVLHVAAAPGEKTAMHQHPDNVTVLLTDGKIVFTGGDGKIETVETKAGQALWSGPQTHAGANVGSTALEAIVVELKGSAPPKATPPASRPNMQMTRLVENARADAYRVTADASFKEEPKTTHDYDQVVIALAPGTMSLEVGGKTTTTWKRGDVAFIGRGQPHQAQNTTGQPTDFVIVAIK